MSVIIGLVLAWLLIIIGMILKGGTIMGILNLPAFLMVMGGTFGALIASFGVKAIPQMFALFKTSMKELPETRPQIIEQLVGFSEKARREGLLVLEDEARNADDPFMARGLRLVVDGTDPELVKDIMDTELDARWRTATSKGQRTYAPGWGSRPDDRHSSRPCCRWSPCCSTSTSPTPSGRRTRGVPRTSTASLSPTSLLPGGQRPEVAHRGGGRRTHPRHRGRALLQSGDNPRVLSEKLWSFMPADQRPSEDGAAGSGSGAGSARGEREAQAA